MTEPSDPTRAESSSEETLLVGYVRQALAALEAGETVDPQELCSAHPELAAPVADALGLRAGLPSLQRAAHDRDPLRDTVLAGRYRLDACLGRGAMGVVYGAIDLELDRRVAIKIFEKGLAADPVDEQRFLREAQLLAALRHAHVVSIHDRGRSEDGLLFLVMEFLEGASLSQVLNASEGDSDGEGETPGAGPELGPWLGELLGDAPPPESSYLRLCVRWLADVASGLGAAHGHGVFHRDVKPSNIFVRRDHTSILLDFGIAARTGDEQLTMTRTALGTPWYMAPEQAAGEERTAATIDVYGLSATLYHLVTLRPPFDGDAATVLAKLLRDDPVPATKLRPDLPRDLQAIVEHGMERDPARRYQDMAALEADLRAFLEHRPVSVRPLSPLGRQWRRFRRAPAKPLAIGAAVLVLLMAVFLVPPWLAGVARENREQKAALAAALPRLLAFEAFPEERDQLPASERRQNLDVLNQILALDEDDLPARVWRAALLLDDGAHDAAAHDMAEVAARLDTPYGRAIAESYAAADRAVTGIAAVRTDGWPEPESDEDLFIAGFHELRYRRDGYEQRAEELLQRAKDRCVPARDLRLVALVALGSAQGKLAPFVEALAEADALSTEVYGRDSVRTLMTRGIAMIAQKRYDDAVAPLQAALALHDDLHDALQNLGVVYRKQNRADEAEACLVQAGALRPFLWKDRHTLAQVCSDQGRYDEAMELASTIPTEGRRGEAWTRPDLMGMTKLYEAISLSPSDPSARQEAASAAAAHFQVALANAPESQRDAVEIRLALARAVEENDLNSATIRFLQVLAKAPDNPYQLANLATLLPDDGLGWEPTAYLSMYLRVLGMAMARGDERFQKEQRRALGRTDEQLRQRLARERR